MIGLFGPASRRKGTGSVLGQEGPAAAHGDGHTAAWRAHIGQAAMTHSAWETTDRDRENYERLLVIAGSKRAAGLCVQPSCCEIPARGALTCNQADCIAFVMDAPVPYIAHWQSIQPWQPDDDEVSRWQPLTALGLVTAGAIIGSVLGVGAIAFALWLGRLYLAVA